MHEQTYGSMKTIVIFTVVLGCIFNSCAGQKSESYENITVEVFAEKIRASPNAQIIDVRTPEEYQSQHIEGAKNINWNGGDFVTEAGKLDKNQPVFVYCLVGGRSKKASDKLVQMGFSKVYDLQGGIMKWNASKFNKKEEKLIGMPKQEFDNLIKSKPKVLVNFYADWCEPCRKMKPYISKMETEMKEEIAVIRLNADENKSLLRELQLDGLPVTLFYENAMLQWSHIGFIREEDLKKRIKK